MARTKAHKRTQYMRGVRFAAGYPRHLGVLDMSAYWWATEGNKHYPAVRGVIDGRLVRVDRPLRKVYDRTRAKREVAAIIAEEVAA